MRRRGIDQSALNVPGGWSDDIFVPFDYGYFAVVYDTEKVKAPPKSLDELVDGDPDIKIVIQDPRTSTPGLGLVLWVKAVYGDKAAEAWAKLKRRVLTVTPGWSEAYGLFTKGEAQMVLSYTTSPAYHMVAENTERYQAAVLRGRSLSADRGRRHDRQWRQEPAVATVPGLHDRTRLPGCDPRDQLDVPGRTTDKPLNAAFDKLVKPAKTLLFSPDEVAANRKAWVDEWLKAMSE